MPLPAALSAAAALAMLGLLLPGSTAAASALLVLWIAAQDLTSYTIPDEALLAFALLAIAERVREPLFAFDPALGAFAIALDGLLAAGAVWLVREAYFRRKGTDGLGFGDVKLAGVGGLLCGLEGFSIALLLASLAGLGVAAGLAATGRNSGKVGAKLPFGAILAPTLWVVWMAGR